MRSNRVRFPVPLVPLALATVASAQTPFFPAPQTPPSATVASTGTADFDFDGYTDVVNACSNQTVRILHGDGHGGFGRAETIHSGANAYVLQVADFTNDGTPDVLLCIQSKLRVLPGLGATGFAAPIDSPAPAFPTIYATADVDGDGDIDLLGAGGPSLQLYRGNGNGTFGAPQPTNVGGFAAELALGDANGDGKLDLWMLDSGISGAQRVALSLGNGDGTFQPIDALPIPDYAMGICAGDWNGDARVDAAVVRRDVSAQPGSILLFEALPSGGILWKDAVPTGTEPFTLATADFDADGDLDLAATLWGVGGVREMDAFTNRGDGTFEPERRAFIGPMSRDLSFARLDPDAFPDAVLVADSAGQITALRGLGDGTFDAPLALVTGDFTRAATVADVVGSSAPDVIAVVGPAAKLALFENQGGGAFAQPVDVAFPGTTWVARAADLDHDTHADLVALVVQGGHLRAATRLSDGAGGFLTATLGAPLRTAYDFALVDVSSDGELDLVTPHHGCYAIELGLGDGTFAPPLTHAAPFGPLALHAVDVTEDGLLDLFALDERHSNVALLPGLGGGQFGVPRVFSMLTPPSSLSLADLDGDAHLDLAVISGTKPSLLTLFAGDGHGGFTVAKTIASGASSISVVAADFTSDGLPDLMHTQGLGGGVTLLENLGHYQFAHAAHHATGQWPTFVLASDLDQNGSVDALTAGGELPGVAVLLRR